MITQRDIARLIYGKLLAARRQLDAQEINVMQYQGKVRTIYSDTYAATAFMRSMSPETYDRVWRWACRMVDLELDGNHIPYDSKEAT